jgi:ketosteroid isomerase-like protein
MDPQELMSIALKFNGKINQQDLEGLAELMTDDHTFVDSDNNTTKGKKTMLMGWKEFFKAYPDYRNTFTCVTTQDNIVVMIGYSTCTHKPLNGPNIWTAKIRGKRVSEWRVIWLDQRQEQPDQQKKTARKRSPSKK